MRQNVDFVGTFTQHKSLKEVGYLIYDTDGFVQDMTSSIIYYLKKKILKNFKVAFLYSDSTLEISNATKSILQDLLKTF